MESMNPASKYFVEVKNYPKIDLPFYEKPGILIDNKYIIPNSVRNLDLVKNIRLREDDVIITGFPKSGKYLLIRLFISSMKSNKNP